MKKQILWFIILILVNIHSVHALDLGISFIPQAPPGSWSGTQNCGPASVLMAMSYHSKEQPKPEGIMAIVDWLSNNYQGYRINNYNGSATSVNQMLALVQAWGFSDSYRFSGWGKAEIKKAIDEGNPVVAAIIAGKISNRGYSYSGGHFITVVGYNSTGFIVNDPGTSGGRGKVYSYAAFAASQVGQNGAGLVVKSSSPSKMELKTPADQAVGIDPESIVFSWVYPANARRIKFTLRDEPKTGYLCDKKDMGLTTSITLSDCTSEKLQPNKSYKWAAFPTDANGNDLGGGFTGIFKTGGNTKVPTLISPAPYSTGNSVSVPFRWSLNNSIVKSIDFTLREFTPDTEPDLSTIDGLTGLDNDGISNRLDGQRGDHVGSCNGKTLSSSKTTTISNISSLCGTSLKENQWYKWSVGLRFGDDTDPTRGTSGYFKTKSTSRQPTLLYPLDSESIHYDSDITFRWDNNNDTSTISALGLGLVELDSSGNEQVVGSCKAKILSAKTTSYSSSNCGESLKPKTSYKWIVAMIFNDDSPATKAEASFTTQAETAKDISRPPILLYPSDSDSIPYDSDITFSWNNNNDTGAISELAFGLMEVDSSGNAVEVGSCKVKVLSAKTTSYSSSNCGESLKPKTSYKWAIAMTFNDGSKGTGYAASFTTQAETINSPDLEISSFSLEKSTVEVGESFWAYVTTKNVGNANSDVSTVRFYRSHNSKISSSDVELSDDTVKRLRAGDSTNDDDNNSIDIAGTYYIGACVDPVSGESNTSNNCSDGYRLVVTDLQQPPSTTRLIGISTRAYVGNTAENYMYAGVTTSGDAGATKKVIIRATGKGLTNSNINTALDAQLEIRSFPAQTLVDKNNAWQNHTRAAETLSLRQSPSDASDAALLTDLGMGNFTANVIPKDNPGIGLIEVYDMDNTSSSRLTGISTRAYVGNTAENYMYAGITVEGTVKVLVRATGQGLVPQGVNTALDARIEVNTFPDRQRVASNDDWESSGHAVELQQRGHTPVSLFDAAMYVTLTTGSYTIDVIPSGAGSPGIGLIEIYEVQ